MMSAPAATDIPRDSWTVAVCGPERKGPIGAGILIDQWRVLTCNHVVERFRENPGQLRVSFRKVHTVPALEVQVARISDEPPNANELPGNDVALLELANPVEIAPAPLLCPEPDSLVGDSWRAFGFPAGSPSGNAAHGAVGTVLADGCVRLDTGSPYVVQPGYSGAGLWSMRYRAVVGLVVQAQISGERRGDATAVTMIRVNEVLPEARLKVLAGRRVDDAGEQTHTDIGDAPPTDPGPKVSFIRRLSSILRFSEGDPTRWSVIESKMAVASVVIGVIGTIIASCALLNISRCIHGV